MKQTMQPISIVVPTLNEEGNIALLFKRIHLTLSQVGIPYEIIVVDDHSTDATAKLVEQAHPKYNARLQLKQGKPGKAFSLLEGFEAAEHELVCMIDGDLQYPPEAIKLMYHKLQYCEADVVLTERVDNKTSAMRRLTSTVFNTVFTRALFGIDYDTQSGLKLFRKSILKTIQVDPSPWTFDLEFIVKALEQNFVIVSQQIPFSKRNAGVPKVHLLSATVEIASGSLKLWRNTSTKHVKLGYRQSETVRNSINTLLVVVASALFMMSASPTSVHAESKKVVAPTTLLPSAKDQTAPSPQKSSAAQPEISSSPAQNGQSAAPNDSAASAQPATQTSVMPVSGQLAYNSYQPAPVTVASASATGKAADPSTFKTVSNSDAAYYPTSSLGKARTERLHKLALNVVIAGGIFIALSLLVIAAKTLTTRIRHQPLRT